MKPIDAPDWVDQDLLTREDAADRLAEEIADDQRRLDALSTGELPDEDRAAARTLLERRISAMTATRAELLDASS